MLQLNTVGSSNMQTVKVKVHDKFIFHCGQLHQSVYEVEFLLFMDGRLGILVVCFLSQKSVIILVTINDVVF